MNVMIILTLSSYL